MKWLWVFGAAVAAYFVRNYYVTQGTVNAVNANSDVGPGPAGYVSPGTGPGASFAPNTTSGAKPVSTLPVRLFWTAQPWNSAQVEPWSPLGGLTPSTKGSGPISTPIVTVKSSAVTAAAPPATSRTFVALQNSTKPIGSGSFGRILHL